MYGASRSAHKTQAKLHVPEMIVVLSTGYAPRTVALCIESVKRQSIAATHIVIDAAKQTPPKAATQNVYEAIAALSPDDIVVWLDADDHFAHSLVLAKIAEVYRDPNVWLTYGQFITSDGKPGFVEEYPANVNVREHRWLASHLRTFRASLFQKLTPEDLQIDGEWITLGVDHAVMFPLIELAGLDRCKFIPEVLYVYHYEESWEKAARPSDLLCEQESVRRIRAKEPKGRVP